MASATYGRLFTMEDMHALLLVADMQGFQQGSPSKLNTFRDRHPRERWTPELCLADYEARYPQELPPLPDGSRMQMTFPSDEPVFVLRASDPESPTLLSALVCAVDDRPRYEELTRPEGLLDEFLRWREERSP